MWMVHSRIVLQIHAQLAPLFKFVTSIFETYNHQGWYNCGVVFYLLESVNFAVATGEADIRILMF